MHLIFWLFVRYRALNIQIKERALQYYAGYIYLIADILYFLHPVRYSGIETCSILRPDACHINYAPALL